MTVRATFLATFLLAQSLSAADQKQISLRWGELEPAMARGKVRIRLPSGPEIEGRVVVVEPQSLRIRITKTSDKRIQPKGEILIPRTAVSVVQVVRHGVRWRIFSTAIGPALVGAAGASVYARGAGSVNDIPKYMGYGAAAVIGTGVGGYFLGKRGDSSRDHHPNPSGEPGCA